MSENRKTISFCKHKLVFATVLFLSSVFLFSGCENFFSQKNTDLSNYAGRSSEPLDNELTLLLIEHRTSMGLTPLLWHDTLHEVALAHSKDMRDRNYISHESLPSTEYPEGREFFERIQGAGISYVGAAENIAAGQSTAATVFQAWLDSPGHRANIEKADLTHHAIALARGGSYNYYWTHKFLKNPTPDN